MRFWQRVEDPRARRARSWVFDVLVVLFSILSGAGIVARSGLSTAPAVVLLVAVNLPLLVRRVWPVPVLAVQVVLVASTGWWNLQLFYLYALLVGIYTVAALRPRRDALLAAAVLEAGAVVVAIHISEGPAWWGNALALSAILVSALAIGLYVGTRRFLLAELRERADRLEYERDQQALIASAAERARIAREMHDIVAHHLTVMVALSEGAVAASAKSPERAAEVMRTVSATGRQALADTRRLLGVLRDDSDGGGERQPLPDLADLEALLHRVRDAGLPVRYEVRGGSPDVPPAVQLTVYRLVQEALTNTMKHAGRGASATVALHYAPEALSVEVRDDGGLLPSATTTPNGSGRGLAGMRERVRAVGGDVRSGPADGRGWQVSATLRLQEVEA